MRQFNVTVEYTVRMGELAVKRTYFRVIDADSSVDAILHAMQSVWRLPGIVDILLIRCEG